MAFRDTSLDTKHLLLGLFAKANPMFCFDELESESPLAPYVREMLLTQSPEFSIMGDPVRVEDRRTRAGIDRRITTHPVTHVFPVFCEWLQQGMMTPLGIAHSTEWSVSDAFGTFGYKEHHVRVTEIFGGFLKRLEHAWKEATGKVLPLRWRRAFDLRIECPLHFDALGGDSLQVPLAIAVLRAFSESLPTTLSGPVMAFGHRPVFATGVLDLQEGTFLPVRGLRPKLEAFVREYGPGLPAVLTAEQVDSLTRTAPALISRVRVYTADSLVDLMRLEELHTALERLCRPPEPPELDQLLHLIFQLQRGIRFSDMAEVIEWLRPSVKSPVYQLKLERNLGLIAAHRGRFQEAGYSLKNAARIHRNHPDLAGIRERIDLTTAWGTMAFDACEPEWVDEIPEGDLASASPEDRAKYWGSWCQIYRLRGDLDRAVDAGRKSVRLADLSLASEAGRDRNYLVHALIARARASDGKRSQDLEEAETLLRESQNEWAPVSSTSARRSHLGFCLHFEAEISRLSGRAFSPPDRPPWEEEWGHPWMFVLLSCARNTRHVFETRCKYAEMLTSFSAEYAKKAPDSLFELFDATYRMYHAALTGGDILFPLRGLRHWLDRREEEGYSGWGLRLAPFAAALSSSDTPLKDAEDLCDAIPYH